MNRCDIKIYNKDCMIDMVNFKNNEFDLAIVDPDYGIERFKKGSLRFDKVGKYKTGLNLGGKPEKKYFLELFRISKKQIIWGANNFILPSSEYFIIWDKQQTVDNFASAEYAWTNCKKPAKIFRYGIHKHNITRKIHPTQKPISLYKWILENYANIDDKIIDTHLGSGSIAIACWDLKFDLTAYEIDKDYYNDARKRLEDHQRQLQLF